MPITWQNIGQANFGDAAGFMQMSSQNANQAFNSAIKRTSEEEAKVKAGKTNAIANQIYGIADPETLRAFQSKLNLEDPSIDSNVVNDAVLRQGEVLARRALDQSNIAQNTQQIEASKAGVELGRDRFDFDVSKEEFDQNSWQKTFDLESQRAKTQQALYGQELTLGKKKIEEANYVDGINKGTTEVMKLMAQGNSLEESVGTVSKGDARTMVDLTNAAVRTQASLLGLNERDQAELQKGLSKYEVQDKKLLDTLAYQEAEFNKKYPTVPTQALDMTAQLEKNGMNSHNKVIEDFTNKLKENDPDSAARFYSQGGNNEDNMGARQLVSAATNKDSTLNRAFRVALGKNATPDTVIDPALLRLSLDAVSPSTNYVQDGIKAVELAKAAAAIQEQRLTAQEYLAKKEEALKPTKDAINVNQADKSVYLKDTTDLYIRTKANAAQRAFTGSVNQAPNALIGSGIQDVYN